MNYKTCWNLTQGYDECDEIKHLRAALAAKDAEIERLRKALTLMEPSLAAVRTVLSSPLTSVERECAYEEMGEILKILHSALSAAPGQKPETCVWRVEDGKRAVTSCYSAVYTWSQIATGPEICPDCGKRVEVRG